MRKNKTLCICGIGPGDPDYISNIVFRKVHEADILVGGKRQLDLMKSFKKRELLFSGNLQQLQKDIERIDAKHIVILVSGDTGFHSLRRFLQDSFYDLPVQCIPGISSFQYFYARLGLGYERAFKASMHGTEIDFTRQLTEYESVFLLTDPKNNWKTIARQLVDAGYGHLPYHIGNRLSYPDEKIFSTTAEEALKLDFSFSLCSVIIETRSFQKRQKQ
jgi:cobalt-precorrin-7 (C5)-methyltransferase